VTALPFRLLSDADKQSVFNSINAVSKDWTTDWFTSPLAVNLSINDEAMKWGGGEWFVIGDAPDTWLAWSMEPTGCRQMVAAMFGTSLSDSSRATPLVKALVQESVSNLFQRIANLLGKNLNLQIYSEPSKALRSGYGSGAIQIELIGDLFKQHLILGGGVIEFLCSSNSNKEAAVTNIRLVNREKTLGKHSARLQVHVGKAEITLQDLAEMQVGDVIRLQAGVKDSFLVQSSDSNQLVARAHLGVVGKHKAIQLIE